MSRPATYDDANLLLKLYELRRDEKLRTARDWFSFQFKAKSLEDAGKIAPEGSQENAYLRMVTTYWDMAASLITTDVLHDELFFESGFEMLACWEKMRPLVPEIRTRFKNPLYLKNLEEVAGRYIKFLDKKAPGMYEAITEMFRS